MGKIKTIMKGFRMFSRFVLEVIKGNHGSIVVFSGYKLSAKQVNQIENYARWVYDKNNPKR